MFKKLGIFFIFILMFFISGCNEKQHHRYEQYQLAVDIGYQGTYDEWYNNIRWITQELDENYRLFISPGLDDIYITWINEGGNRSNRFLRLDMLIDPQGVDDRDKIKYRISEEYYIQWKYDYEDGWENLISLNKIISPNEYIENIEYRRHPRSHIIQWKFDNSDDWISIVNFATPQFTLYRASVTEELFLNTPMELGILFHNDYDTFKFTPTYSGKYTFKTSSPSSIQLIKDDNVLASENSDNISYILEKEQEYTLKVTNAIEYSIYVCTEDTISAGNTNITDTVKEYDGALFKFTPTETNYYNLEINIKDENGEYIDSQLYPADIMRLLNENLEFLFYGYNLYDYSNIEASNNVVKPFNKDQTYYILIDLESLDFDFNNIELNINKVKDIEDLELSFYNDEPTQINVGFNCYHITITESGYYRLIFNVDSPITSLYITVGTEELHLSNYLQKRWIEEGTDIYFYSINNLSSDIEVTMLIYPEIELILADGRPNDTSILVDSSSALYISLDGEIGFLHNYEWNSNAPNIATVDSNGVVIGVSRGITKITGTYGNFTVEMILHVKEIKDVNYYLLWNDILKIYWDLPGLQELDSGLVDVGYISAIFCEDEKKVTISSLIMYYHGYLPMDHYPIGLYLDETNYCYDNSNPLVFWLVQDLQYNDFWSATLENVDIYFTDCGWNEYVTTVYTYF